MHCEAHGCSTYVHSAVWFFICVVPHDMHARRPHVASPNFYSAPVGGTCGGFLVRCFQTYG